MPPLQTDVSYFRSLDIIAFLIDFSPPDLVLVPDKTQLTIFISYLVHYWDVFMYGGVRAHVCAWVCNCGICIRSVLGTWAWNKS